MILRTAGFDATSGVTVKRSRHGRTACERTRRGGTTRARSRRAISKLVSVLFTCVVSAAGLSLEARLQANEPEELKRLFEQEIRPLLVENCVSCHGEKKQEGGLRLDSREGFGRGGDSGRLIAENWQQSMLLEAIRYEGLEMPPKAQLDAKSIRQFENWISLGAKWPDTTEMLRAPSDSITAEDRDWWAFQPFDQASPPALPPNEWSKQWASNPVDVFVAGKLIEQNLRPAPVATKAQLARRVYFDLLGVPPTPEEVEEFVRDDAPNAWESLVDRLLNDTRYGEHWARFWLDLVRYSESDGWNQDAYRPHIWRYRDYVVNSLNADKRYPQFVREQLAGDEIGEDNPEHWVATGFLRLGIYEYNQRDARGHWNDIMNEMTDVAGDVFMGLSMACARCHDHKFDPIPQVDYFKLRAFFEPISWRDDIVAASESQKASYAAKYAKYAEQTRNVQERIDALLEPYHKKKWESTVDKFPLDIQACFHMPVAERTSWQNQMAYLVSRQFLEEGGGPLKAMSKADKAKHEELLKELAAFESAKPKALPVLMTATDFAGIASPTFVQDDPSRSPVQPAYLQVMASLESGKVRRPDHLPLPSTGRRTALAEWIGDRQNPLTNRVIVNRVWQQHFGKGIVSTPNDFGSQGQLPTHPELLDWLTQKFVESGGSLKQLHKLILLSSTWRQSVTHPHASQCEQLDPGEALLWRYPLRRLQAEQIRDALLSASGELDGTLGGPSVDEKKPRRSLYVKSYRNRNENFLFGFDMANGLKSVPIRDRTTTATQALLMFNGSFVLGRAKVMAKNVLAETNNTSEAIRRCYYVAWGREPSEAEFSAAADFLGLAATDAATETAEVERQPLDEVKLADLCHVLFNSNQFLYCE